MSRGQQEIQKIEQWFKGKMEIIVGVGLNVGSVCEFQKFVLMRTRICNRWLHKDGSEDKMMERIIYRFLHRC